MILTNIQKNSAVENAEIGNDREKQIAILSSIHTIWIIPLTVSSIYEFLYQPKSYQTYQQNIF